MAGRATAHSRAISPNPRMPISSTSTSVSSACAEDRDRQPLLVVEAARVRRDAPVGADAAGGEVLGRRLADAAGDADHRARRAGARPSAASVQQRRPRCRRPRSPGSRTAGVGRARRQVRAGPGVGRRRDELVAVALGHDRHEQLARRARAASRTTPRRASTSGPTRRPADRRGRLGCPESSRPPNGTVRRWPMTRPTPEPRATASTSSCCSAASRPSTTSSCTTAAHVLRAVDPARYRITPSASPPRASGRSAEARQRRAGRRARRAARTPRSVGTGGRRPRRCSPPPPTTRSTVVLPLLHGPLGEDGTVQGMLELANVAYVGTGVLGSAAGDGQGDGQAGARRRTASPRPATARSREHELDAGTAGRSSPTSSGCRASSSPPTWARRSASSRRTTVEELRDAIDVRAHATTSGSSSRRRSSAARSRWPCSATPTRAPRCPARSCPGDEFYGYEDKYVTDGAQLLDPGAARRRREPTRCARSPCEVFRALRCEGMARVDFFYEEGGRGFLCNEVNTMPGFTPISMYPKLWQASGLSYPAS